MSGITSTLATGDALRLDIDLGFPGTLNNAPDGFVSASSINTTAGLTELIGLSGKYAIQYLRLGDLTTESVQIKLTIDGVVVWDDTFVLPDTSLTLQGATNLLTGGIDAPFIV